MSGHDPGCEGCQIVGLLDRAEKAEAESIDLAHALADVEMALAKANALRPDDFKTGQGHLSPAFREVDFKAAFRTLAEIVNEIERAVAKHSGGSDA